MAQYGLYRDRKALWANPAAFVAWIFLFLSLSVGINGSLRIKGTPDPWLNLIFQINCILFAIRSIQRIRFTWEVYGRIHGLLAFPRMFYSNLINGCASLIAFKNFKLAKKQGATDQIAWAKTDHKFPELEELANLNKNPSNTKMASPH
jgi:adsorption protein B